MTITERSIDVGPVELAIREAGEGGRPLLLVHGFTGAATDFVDFLDPLAEAGWHVVAPDLRGHGGSSHPTAEDDYSFELFAGDVTGLADALGFDRFTLLGHSMGGMIVQVLALSAPERIEALILAGHLARPAAGRPRAGRARRPVARSGHRRGGRRHGRQRRAARHRGLPQGRRRRATPRWATATCGPARPPC
jgi:pimeloyl-ACP methyl ester carboxylesterase